MPAHIRITVPDELFEPYGDLKTLEREVFIDFVLQERQKGNISLGRAAEILGISYTACYDLLVERGLPIENVSPEEREEDYHRNKAFMKPAKNHDHR